MLIRATALFVLLVAYVAAAEPSPECQAAIDSDLAAGATLDSKRNELAPNRVWLTMTVAGREAAILHECADDVRLRSMLLEFPDLAEATQLYENRRDNLLRLEGTPEYGIDDVERDYPRASAALKNLRRTNVLREYRWENEERLVVLSLSKENSGEVTVVEVDGRQLAKSDARRRITRP